MSRVGARRVIRRMTNGTYLRTAAALMLSCIIIAAMVISSPSRLHAQPPYSLYDSTYGGLVFGLHGFGRTFAEVGLARMTYDPTHDGPALAAYAVSVMVSPSDTTLLAAGVSGWYQVLMFGVGWTFAYYTDLHGGTFRISPQVFMGSDRFNVSIAMIFPLTNRDFTSVPEGEIMARWTLPLWGSRNRHRPRDLR